VVIDRCSYSVDNGTLDDVDFEVTEFTPIGTHPYMLVYIYEGASAVSGSSSSSITHYRMWLSKVNVKPPQLLDLRSIVCKSSSWSKSYAQNSLNP
jgi:hypothetical protein